MAANKTQPTEMSVDDHLAGLDDERRRADAIALTELMQLATGAEPVMWGTAIVGFGTHHYVYDSGREGDIAAVSFAARKKSLVLYGVLNYDELPENRRLAEQLGDHTTGKGCLYIETLETVDADVLGKMVSNAFQERNNELPGPVSGDGGI